MTQAAWVEGRSSLRDQAATTWGQMMSIIERRPADLFSEETSTPQQQTAHQRVERRQSVGPDLGQQTPGWFDDPELQHRMRYFDGAGWTGHVTHFGPTPCSGCG